MPQADRPFISREAHHRRIVASEANVKCEMGKLIGAGPRRTRPEYRTPDRARPECRHERPGRKPTAIAPAAPVPTNRKSRRVGSTGRTTVADATARSPDANGAGAQCVTRSAGARPLAPAPVVAVAGRRVPMPSAASVREMETRASSSVPLRARIASIVSGMTMAWLSTM